MKNSISISMIAFVSALFASGMASATILNEGTSSNTTTSTAVGTQTYEVAAGCLAPSGYLHNTYYIDPLHGKISNAGTAAAPWDTLANVIAQKKSIIKGGDVLNLMTGNHGAVSIGNWVNSNFITVQAAPGQAPVLTKLAISGGQNWIFEGLKIQATGPVHLFSVGTYFTGVISQNIIFTNNTLASQDNVSSWSKADWVANAANAIDVDGRPDVVDAASPVVNNVDQSHHSTNCISVTNNNISNVRAAVGFNADHSLFKGNFIHNYADDAVDFGGNYLTLSYNKITDVNDIGDGIHPDGFQGFLPGGKGYNASTFSNVLVDHNTIIRQSTANLPFSGTMQGIDNFDGGGYRDWYNLSVTNNFIVTNGWNAIFFGGIHNSLIAHNIVLGDGVKTSQINQGSGPAPVTAPGNTAWVGLADYNHFSQKSSNVTVTDNVGVSINASGATDPTDIISHNVASATIDLYVKGKIEYNSKPGTYGDGNIIEPNLNKYFTSVSTVSTPNGPMFVYNTNWTNDSPYKGMGISASAPQPPTTNPISPGPVTAYTGTLNLTVNARQDGSPALKILLDGKVLGTEAITANVHDGQIGKYTITYTSTTKPQKLDVVLDGYTATEEKYVSTNLFNLDFTENNSPRVDLVRQATGEVKSGSITLTPTSADFYTNGSTLEYDISKL